MLRLVLLAKGRQIAGNARSARNAMFVLRQMSKESKPPKKCDPPKGAAPPKEKKDETAIQGGTKCPPKKKTECPPPKAEKKGCDKLIKPKPKPKLTEIQGGTPCGRKRKVEVSEGGAMQMWRKISLFAILPMVAILTLFVFTTHKEHEHPEFVYHPYKYRRTKPFYFGDGNRSFFHNRDQNALPPAGYEDEIDEEGVGQEPETEKEKKQRLKEFEKVLKDWQKHVAAQEAAEEKERKKQEKEAAKQNA